MDKQPTKVCRVCGGLFTYDKLSKSKKSIGGVQALCKTCHNKRTKTWYENNKERSKETNRKWRLNNAERSKETKRKWRLEHPERIKELSKRHRIKNAEKIRAKARQYHKDHPEILSNWVKNNRERILETRRKRYQKNPEKYRKAVKQWNKENYYKVRLAEQKRYARNKSLPDTLTLEEWENCVNYFSLKCVYCGEHVERLSMDHFIPLANSACPGTVIDNILPACTTCNIRKNDCDPYVWIYRSFETHQALHVICTIQMYFQHLNFGVWENVYETYT